MNRCGKCCWGAWNDAAAPLTGRGLAALATWGGTPDGRL